MIRKTMLENGMTVLTEAIPHANSVTMGLWVKAGSRLETPQNAGISHFLEHMNFKGTARRSAKELAKVLEARGGHLNAYTAKEHTSFYCQVVDKDYKLAMDVLADLFCGSVFDPQEIEKEQRVVLEEINLYEDSPDDYVIDLLNELIWKGHPLAHPILGYADTVRAFTRDDLLAYRGSHYLPADTVFAAAGSLDHDRIVEEAARWFADYKNDGESASFDVPVMQSGRAEAQKDINQEHICIAVPGASIFDDDYYPLILINEVLGGGSSSRLFQSIREDLGLAYSVFSFISGYQDCGLIGIYAGTGKGRGEQTAELCYKELADIRAHGLTAEELSSIKEEIKGSMLIGQDSIATRLNRLARNELYHHRLIPIEEVTAAIDAITNEDILDVAERKLRRENCGFAFLGGND